MSTVPLSTRVRAETRADHGRAETSIFVEDLMGGRLGLAAYSALAAQLWYVYDALESGARQVTGDPDIGPFLDPALSRLEPLTADLDSLDASWRDGLEPLPSTQTYVERLHEVAAEWPGGYLAHHYTRYLGDLSGGQVVRTMLQRHYAAPDDVVRFFSFADIPDRVRFKEDYRRRLDALPWTPAQHQAFLSEVSLAYRLNAALFEDLALSAAS